MTVSSKNVDMLNGSLWDKILLFALPIAASAILQQLFNSADLAVVGRFAGSGAVAAVGSNAPVINLMINLFIGLSIGANVIIGNLLGQKKIKDTRDAVHTAISVAIISGIFLIGVGFVLARPILTMMGAPEEIIELAVVYLRIYFSGMPFVMLYNFGSAILRSKGDTKRPLYCLIISGVINVILNLILVIIFHLDVAGVAIATVIANAVSAVMIVSFLMTEERAVRLSFRKLSINRTYLIRMIKIGVPAGLQAMVFNFSNIVIQSAINSFGTSVMAGSAAALNYEFYSYFIVNAFNQASISFTSQNYGAGKFERCKKIFNICAALSVLLSMGMISFFIIFRKFCIGIYTTDPVAIEFGMRRILVCELFDCLVISYELAAATLRAMGHSLLPALQTIFGICVFRLFWIATVFRHYRPLISPIDSFSVLLAVYPASWLITGTIVLSTYFFIRRKDFRTKIIAV